MSLRAKIYPGVKDALTNRPCEIGLIECEDGTIILAMRYTVGVDNEWFPTWVGPLQGAVRIPRGTLKLNRNLLHALATAPKSRYAL